MTTLNELSKKIDQLPARVLNEPVKLAGNAGTGTTTLRTKIAYAAHEHRATQRLIASAQAAVVKAVQQAGKAQGLTDEQVEKVATAAAEAAARVSAEAIAEQLEVTVAKGD